jgi:hypothetical protein
MILGMTVSVGEESAMQCLDHITCPGQEQPAGLHAVPFGKRSQGAGRIVFWIDGQRVHEDISPNPVTEQPLHLYEVRGHRIHRIVVDGHAVDQHELAP